MYSHEFKYFVGPDKKVYLFIFGDIQLHSKGFSEEMFREFKEDFLNTPNALCLGLGDYGDFTRPSVRSKISSIIDKDKSLRNQFDDIVKEDVKKLSEKFSFLKGKIIGLHSGHHEWEFGDGTNSTQMLCNLLKTNYLGWTAYTILKLAKNRDIVVKNKSLYKFSLPVKIYSTHGSGGGAYNSTDMGNLEKKIAPFWFADLYFRGHSSKGELCPLPYNDVTVKGTPRIVLKTRWIINCPGMMNGYLQEKDDGKAPQFGYVEYNNLPPASLGYVKCEIKYGNYSSITLDGTKAAGLKINPSIVSPHVYGQQYEN